MGTFLARGKSPGGGWRDRRGEVLFIDARKMGALVDRTRKELSDEDISRIAGVYHAWRGEPEASAYADVPGFCASASLEDIRGHGHVLTPGRYVGAADVEDNDAPFVERFATLRKALDAQFQLGAELEATIRASLGNFDVR